jgi:hypothetical protein
MSERKRAGMVAGATVCAGRPMGQRMAAAKRSRERDFAGRGGCGHPPGYIKLACFQLVTKFLA